MRSMRDAIERIPVAVALVVPAAALALIDLRLTLWGDEVPPLYAITPRSFAEAAFAVTVLLVVLNLGAAVLVARIAEHALGSSKWPWLVLAAAFGFSWQDTLMHGDGIRSHPWFAVIRIGGAIGGPLAVAGFVWLVAFFKRVDVRWRYLLAAVASITAASLHFHVLTDYRPFHGHLAAFATACATWALLPVWKSPLGRLGATAVLLLALVAAARVFPERESIQSQVQHFSHVPASVLEGLPLARPFRIDAVRMVDGAGELTGEQRALARQIFSAGRASGPNRKHGDSVLMVVLESTRSDDWSDPDLTPRFHRYRRRGLYFPRAIAQYPATPLAYGAMFTGQPPSVLAQSPYWGQYRLFDYLRPSFDHILLTRPENKWFEHNAITDFFVPRDLPPHGHENGAEALDYVRDRLEEIDPDDSYFAWVHLYEPHAPYRARREFLEGRGRRAKYRSEVAWTDAQLGEFVQWFHTTPHAEDTLLVIVSDHGEGMGERIMGKRFWGHHVHVHQVVNRIPLYLSGPGLPADRVEDELQVAQLDILPTIFDFLGGYVPADAMVQGRSIYRLLEERPTRPIVTEAFSIRGTKFFDFVQRAGEADPSDIRERFYEISTKGSRYSPKISLQHGPYKLVYDRTLRRHWLYDTRNDPDEAHDLSGERADVLRDMQQRLEDWTRVQSWVIERLNGRLVHDEPPVD